MSKENSIEIQTCGDQGMLWAKGHHDKEVFAAECASQWGCIEPRPIEVFHSYWRVVPDRTEDYDSTLIEATAGKRGAFAVTYAQVCF